MSASSAIVQYVDAGAAVIRRCHDQTPRLPISWKAPRSPSDANDIEMKSEERLFRVACDRPAAESRIKPDAKAVPSRELHKVQSAILRNTACL